MNPEKLDDILTQDVFVLNVQRSIQACIDVANIIIAENGWKLPSNYKESFSIILDKKIIPEDLAKKMMKMCGFRNIAVHNYQEITSEIEEIHIQMLRNATTLKRFARARSLSRTVIQLSRRAISRSRPSYSEREVNLALISLHYGEDLALKVKQFIKENNIK